MRIIIVTFILFLSSLFLYADQSIVSRKVTNVPVIDGKVDNLWKNVKGITTYDSIAQIDLKIKSVYTDKEVFFLVSFPDDTESRIHKSWVWNKEIEIYDMGNDREDLFIFKWNIDEKPVDLTLSSDSSYKADIWFWKACRTDPLGYADDKSHLLGIERNKNCMELLSKTGKKRYLKRSGDSGRRAYKTQFIYEHTEHVVPRFKYQEPDGSRADVKAKGIWSNGEWVIEFKRALNTGNDDDIQFKMENYYYFGVSRYEISGIPENKMLSQPLYNSGEVTEGLILSFEK